MEMSQLLTNKKLIAAIVAIVVLLILAVLILPGALSTRTLNAYFEKASVRPGDSTNLIVEVTSTYPEALQASVSAEAVDKTALTVTNPVTTTALMGKGETRKFIFPVSVSNAENMLEGKYSVQVTSALGDHSQDLQVFLEVKK